MGEDRILNEIALLRSDIQRLAARQPAPAPSKQKGRLKAVLIFYVSVIGGLIITPMITEAVLAEDLHWFWNWTFFTAIALVVIGIIEGILTGLFRRR
ncbi:MAG: hypothetical protein OXN80_02370 [bacterium]|nr:hypothetical protein [bacterium]